MNFVKACAVLSCTLAIIPCAHAQSAASPTKNEPAQVISPAAPPSSATPDVATLLFGRSQWASAPVGSKIVYAYSKQTTQAAFGPSFNDQIVLTLDPGDDAKSRTAEVKMFSGLNAKPAGPFQSDEQNPVLLLVLEQNVQELSKLFKANPRYLKNAIRKAWRDSAKIERVPVEVGGKAVDGTRITIQPFVNDVQSDQMMGLDTLTYVVEIADAIPGDIASMAIQSSEKPTPKFSETLHYQSEAKP